MRWKEKICRYINSVLDPGVEGPVLRSKLTKLIAEATTADM